MLLHFAFYTLLRLMCHKFSIQFIEDSRVKDFTFYILLCAIFSCVVINWLDKFKLTEMDAFTFCLLHFAFYTLLHPIGHNSIGNNEDSRVNCFTFYILHCSIFSSVAINWFGKLKFSSMDAFAFCLLHLATADVSQMFHPVYWRLKSGWFYILHFTLWYLFLRCYQLIG